MKYGWRLTRRVMGDGQEKLERRCPKCWAQYRARRTAEDERKTEGCGYTWTPRRNML
jgi:hypothetical protein